MGLVYNTTDRFIGAIYVPCLNLFFLEYLRPAMSGPLKRFGTTSIRYIWGDANKKPPAGKVN